MNHLEELLFSLGAFVPIYKSGQAIYHIEINNPSYPSVLVCIVFNNEINNSDTITVSIIKPHYYSVRRLIHGSIALIFPALPELIKDVKERLDLYLERDF